MRYKRKCPVCGTLILIEAVEDDGNVFAEDSMDCPECQAFLAIEWKPSVSEIEIDDDDVLSDEQFMKELEALNGPDDVASSGTDLPDPESEEEPTDDGGDGQRYTRQKWIQKETDSYGEYLQQMSGTELIGEYRRQGGEEAAYFDPESEEIVVEAEKERGERTTD